MSENKAEYRRFIEKREDIPVFFRDWWLDAVAGDNWEVILLKNKQGEIQAVLPFTFQKRLGFKVCTQAPLTSFLGLKIFYPDHLVKEAKRLSFENDLSRRAAKAIETKGFVYFNQLFPPDYTNWKGFYWQGYEQSVFYRYILKGIQDRDQLKSQLQYNKKYENNKFKKSGFIIEKSDDTALMYDLIEKSYAHNGGKVPFSKALYVKLNENIDQHSQHQIFIVKDQSGKSIAGANILIDFDRAYLLNTGMDYSNKDSSIMTALIWHTINTTADQVDTFDFCGSMIEPISNYFQGFGGVQVPYFRIWKYRYKWMKILKTSF